MEKVVRKFVSHEEAERAEREYYRSRPPEPRLDILLDLIAAAREQHDETVEGFERVYRVVKLGER